MLILFILIALLAIHGVQVKKSGIYDDYICKGQCNAIKAIFIIMVFIPHVYAYIRGTQVIGDPYDMSGLVDTAGLKLYFFFGQLIVAMFLFYSGYGTMVPIMSKGEVYIDSMPKKRILTTMLNFGVAVVISLSFVSFG